MYKSRKTFLATIAILIGIGLSASATFAETAQSLTGCLKSQNGRYVLQNAARKQDVHLLGAQNFASYVGHSITVHGRFAITNNVDAGNNRLAESKGSFIVTKWEPVAQSCTLNKAPQLEQAASGKPSPYHK